jgi:hypothetical protein
MSEFDARIVDELRLAVPVTAAPDWDAVLRASGHRAHRRAVLALVTAVAAGVVATALAAGLGHRFSSWLSGNPGVPAPTGLQQGFDARNRAAYAGFPAGTKLRLLLSVHLAGTTFSLLGFRNGDDYCLRLVRANHPNLIGRNECLRAEELSNTAALAAGDVYFTVGKPAQTVSGIYGFADDDTRAIVVERERGTSMVPVRNNVFLSLQAQPAGTVQHHPLPNPVLVIRARSQSGGTTVVPYVTGGGLGGIVPGGRAVRGPAYFGPPPHGKTPGPSKVDAPIAHPTVAWLTRRERVGKPLPRVRFGHPVFGRVIQPDPDDPTEIGYALTARGTVCEYEFMPLTGPESGVGCHRWFQAGPLDISSWGPGPMVRFHGLAADGITRVAAFLASGRVVRAALKHNVFTVAVPEAELPGRIVGYDGHDRVAGIFDVAGNRVLQPCPKPIFTKPVADLPAPRPWERIDLRTLEMNGSPIFGRTPAQVEAALGRPAVWRPRDRALRYGGTLPSTTGLQINFAKRGSELVAVTLYFSSPSLVDAKLGHLLRLDPSTLQRQLKTTYGASAMVAYGSVPQLGCTAELQFRSPKASIGLGIDPNRPSRPYLEITKGLLP